MREREKKSEMKPPQKELVADGNRQKPPRSKSIPSTTSSEALTLMGDIDDEITTTASESYPPEESSSNEGIAECVTNDRFEMKMPLLRSFVS